jgi:hypothetical protein
VSFEVGTVGALELHPRRTDGRSWEGMASFEIAGDMGGDGTPRFRSATDPGAFRFQNSVQFTHAPYLVEALPVGRYRVTMTVPFHAEIDSDNGSLIVDGARVQSVPLTQTEERLPPH